MQNQTSPNSDYFRFADYIHINESSVLLLVVEQPHAGEYCHHAVLVTDFDDIIVFSRCRPALRYRIRRSFLALSMLSPNGKKASLPRETPLMESRYSLLFLCKRLRFFCEQGLPYAVLQDILVLVPQVDVDGIIAVRSGHIVSERQVDYDIRLSQMPEVRFVSCQSGAVDPGLLSCAYADGLSVLCIGDRIGLGVFEGDQCDDQVALRLLWQIFVCRNDVGQLIRRNLIIVSALFKGDAEDLFLSPAPSEQSLDQF